MNFYPFRLKQKLIDNKNNDDITNLERSMHNGRVLNKKVVYYTIFSVVTNIVFLEYNLLLQENSDDFKKLPLKIENRATKDNFYGFDTELYLKKIIERDNENKGLSQNDDKISQRLKKYYNKEQHLLLNCISRNDYIITNDYYAKLKTSFTDSPIIREIIQYINMAKFKENVAEYENDPDKKTDDDLREYNKNQKRLKSYKF